MGTYTFYIGHRFTEGVIIDWDSMNTETLFKFRYFERCYKNCTTLSEVGMEFNETKLFGYFTSDLIDAMYEFNSHLTLTQHNPELQGPTLYYEWEGGNIAYALEFNPKSNIVYHHSFEYHDLVNDRMSYDERYQVLQSLPELDRWAIEIL
jgi:hypothetical protein